jgi:hypothetical protein
VNLPSRIRTGSAVRGGGVALACLMPGLANRTRAVLASYGVGWPLGKPGLQLFIVVPDDDAPDWQKAVLPFATSAVSWTLLMTGVATLVRRTSLPAPVGAVLLGGAVVVGDSLLVEVGERVKASRHASTDPVVLVDPETLTRQP